MTTPDSPQTGIDYERLVEDALRSVVHKSLSLVVQIGLPGNTHFYISFATTHPGVKIDPARRAEHPESMTIVLQHQFTDLVVADDHFEVTLFFGGKPSPMIIPFDSVTNFSDPSVGFGLQFSTVDEDSDDKTDETDDNSNNSTGRNTGLTTVGADSDNVSADVVSLDTFRKKPTK
jgi:hypothetical protein